MFEGRKMNALGRVLKIWENNKFSLPALIQRKGKRMWENEQPRQRRGVLGKAPGFS